MPKLSPINSKDLIKILEKLGFENVHQKGSHVRMKHADGRRTTIPVHSVEKVGLRSNRQIRCVFILTYGFQRKNNYPS